MWWWWWWWCVTRARKLVVSFLLCPEAQETRERRPSVRHQWMVSMCRFLSEEGRGGVWQAEPVVGLTHLNPVSLSLSYPVTLLSSLRFPFSFSISPVLLSLGCLSASPGHRAGRCCSPPGPPAGRPAGWRTGCSTARGRCPCPASPGCCAWPSGWTASSPPGCRRSP